MTIEVGDILVPRDPRRRQSLLVLDVSSRGASTARVMGGELPPPQGSTPTVAWLERHYRVAPDPDEDTGLLRRLSAAWFRKGTPSP